MIRWNDCLAVLWMSLFSVRSSFSGCWHSGTSFSKTSSPYQVYTVTRIQKWYINSCISNAWEEFSIETGVWTQGQVSVHTLPTPPPPPQCRATAASLCRGTPPGPGPGSGVLPRTAAPSSSALAVHSFSTPETSPLHTLFILFHNLSDFGFFVSVVLNGVILNSDRLSCDQDDVCEQDGGCGESHQPPHRGVSW